MLDFYLGVNNSLNNGERSGDEVLHIPVTPPKFTVESPQSVETFETSGYGWIKLIGEPELKSVSWDGTFPVHGYGFRRDSSMNGQEYADKLESWRQQKLPIRLVIASTGIANTDINMAVVAEQFSYEVGSTGDLEYSITLGEIRLLTDIQEDLTMAQYEDLIQRLNDIEDRITQIEDKMIYNWVDDNMPSWARSTITKLYRKGYITGDEQGELGLTHEMLRTLVILDRAGCFD